MLKIWGRTNSINVQKVLWCCGELKLQYDRVDAGGKFGVNNTPEYLAMNPNGLVPTINDDGSYTARDSGRDIRVYRRVDLRLMFGDLFDKLTVHDSGR